MISIPTIAGLSIVVIIYTVAILWAMRSKSERD